MEQVTRQGRGVQVGMGIRRGGLFESLSVLCLACTAKLASNDDIGFLIFPNAVSKFVTCASLSIPNKIPST